MALGLRVELPVQTARDSSASTHGSHHSFESCWRTSSISGPCPATSSEDRYTRYNKRGLRVSTTTTQKTKRMYHSTLLMAVVDKGCLRLTLVTGLLSLRRLARKQKYGSHPQRQKYLRSHRERVDGAYTAQKYFKTYNTKQTMEQDNSFDQHIQSSKLTMKQHKSLHH